MTAISAGPQLNEFRFSSSSTSATHGQNSEETRIMLKKPATIALATSIVFAPVAAMAQAGPPVTANHSREGVITAGTMATPKAVAMPANAKSAACTKEASAKGLSGKPRKKFIAKCEKGRNGAGMY